MRIGEVLGLTMNDIDITEKIRLMEGERRERPGRVCLPPTPFSSEALVEDRKKEETYLFYGQHNGPFYSAAPELLRQVSPKARLDQRVYGSLACANVCFGVA